MLPFYRSSNPLQEVRNTSLRVFSNQGLPPLLEKLAETMDNMTFATIPGADHAYTHQRDYVWGMVRQWLEKV